MMQALTPRCSRRHGQDSGSVEMALGPLSQGSSLIAPGTVIKSPKFSQVGLFHPEDTCENWVSQEVLVKVKSEKDLCKPAGSQQ